MAAAKNIALFIDGTWNAPAGATDTNVRKLFEWSLVDPSRQPHPKQLCYYIPGVGEDLAHLEASGDAESMTSNREHRRHFPPRRESFPRARNLLRAFTGGFGGWGTAARIQEAYAYLCQHYDRASGDRVYIFGFSRGAFAARSLTGFISRVGILFARHLGLLPEAYRLYELDVDGRHSWLAAYMSQLPDGSMIETQEDPRAMRIHFLGVWDTVGALGLPWRTSRFEAPYTEHQVTLPPNVFVARHAMALHELRRVFKVMLWAQPHPPHGNLRQVWFPGDHADVGGGHILHETGYSDNALRWMAHEAAANGLLLHPGGDPRPGHIEVLHQMWKWFLVSDPEIRRELRMLATLQFGDWAHAAYFHSSVRRHLLQPKPAAYTFFPRMINPELADVDKLAVPLVLLSRLQGLVPAEAK